MRGLEKIESGITQVFNMMRMRMHELLVINPLHFHKENESFKKLVLAEETSLE